MDNDSLSENDALSFADEQPTAAGNGAPAPWKVLIVDDDQEVHLVTRAVLGGFTYNGRGILFLSASSRREAEALLAQHPDTALILLDVVMETQDAGLALVRHVRETLNNCFVQIILRTGQPGQAPEQEVITRYDINDYKDKTELTAQKLFTAVATALRAYENMLSIEKSRQGLEQVIAVTTELFRLQSLDEFSAAVLVHVAEVLGLDAPSFCAQNFGSVRAEALEDFRLVAATGAYRKHMGARVGEAVPSGLLRKAVEIGSGISGISEAGQYLQILQARNGSASLVYFGGCRGLSDLEKNLLRILAANWAVAFENICLKEDIADTQREVIFTLGEVLESRSRETANHVRRVAEFSHLLALKLGLDQPEADLIRLASPMHDIGKIGVPDGILHKIGRLDTEEYEVMKTHAEIGYDILRSSPREILQAAAIIAFQHHERWDGTGYPRGLRAEEIHVYGRIVALADVFDALSHARSYKPAWGERQIGAFFQDSRGREFDPALVDGLLAHTREFQAINEALPD